MKRNENWKYVVDELNPSKKKSKVKKGRKKKNKTFLCEIGPGHSCLAFDKFQPSFIKAKFCALEERKGDPNMPKGHAIVVCTL